MGLFLIQFPLEYRKKLSDGDIVRSFFFRRWRMGEICCSKDVWMLAFAAWTDVYDIRVNSPRGCTSKSMFARDNPPTPPAPSSSVGSVSHVWQSLAKKAPVATCHCVVHFHTWKFHSSTSRLIMPFWRGGRIETDKGYNIMMWTSYYNVPGGERTTERQAAAFPTLHGSRQLIKWKTHGVGAAGAFWSVDHCGRHDHAYDWEER